MNDRKVLVVGGAGYVGNVLVRRLLAAGYRVRVLDRLIFDHGSALAGVFEEPGLSFVRGDLATPTTSRGALEGVTDAVLLAATGRRPDVQQVPGARAVRTARAPRHVRPARRAGLDRFVFTSTC